MIRIEGFNAPVHPHFEHGSLFDQASKFQSWFISQTHNPLDQTHTIETTSKIMQIAESINLDQSTQDRAGEELSNLSDDLSTGVTRLSEMPRRLDSILQHLKDASPGAKVIDTSMTLQFKTMHEFDPEDVSLLKPHFDQIYSKAGQTDPLHLEALNRSLTEMLRLNHPPDVLSNLLETGVKEYLF